MILLWVSRVFTFSHGLTTRLRMSRFFGGIPFWVEMLPCWIKTEISWECSCWFKPSGHLSANILFKNLAYPEETTTLSKFHHRDALIPWPQRVIKEKSSILLQKGPQIKPKLVTVNFPNEKKKRVRLILIGKNQDLTTFCRISIFFFSWSPDFPLSGVGRSEAGETKRL